MSVLMLIVGVINVAVIAYLIRYSGSLRGSETRLIDATRADVYARIADFCRWEEWSPWLEHQADATVTLPESPDTAGACYAWQGSKIGACRVEHLRLLPSELIEQQLTGIEPFEYRVKVQWTFADRDGKTEVTVRFNGRVPLAKRVYARTVKGILALDFRYGLNKLACLLEPANASHYSVEHLGIRAVEGLRYAHATYSGAITGVASAVRKGLDEVKQKLTDLGIKPAGSALCVYARTNVKARATVCHMGYPVADVDLVGKETLLSVRQLPRQEAYVVRLKGTHSALEVAWYEAMLRMRAESIQMNQSTPPFERYLNEAGSMEEQELLTELYIPVAAAPQTAN